MEKIKQQIEEEREIIESKRRLQDEYSLNNDTTMICRIGHEINYQIGHLNGLILALYTFEDTMPKAIINKKESKDGR